MQVGVLPATLLFSVTRLDILVFSHSTRIIVIIELTSPCEENMDTT